MQRNPKGTVGSGIVMVASFERDCGFLNETRGVERGDLLRGFLLRRLGYGKLKILENMLDFLVTPIDFF